MNSTSKLLSFYFDMLFVNSIQSVKDSFNRNPTLKTNGYSYIQEYDYCMKEDIIENNGAMPIFINEIITKEDFFVKLLNFENTSIYENIDLQILKEPGFDNTIYLKSIFDNIEILLKKTKKLDDTEINIIEDKLIEIISVLKERFSNLLDYHNVFKYLKKETDSTFFKDKDLKYSFYVDLYEMAYSLNLIDDSEIEENDFINAFTSPNPQLLENKVRFFCNNYIVAYFLESLKPFFHELSHSKIEQSKVLLNKQNKPLKSNDIYVSLSRGKDKIEVEKTKIDIALLKLKIKHLK